MALTHPDRLFPVEAKLRDLTCDLYQSVANLPIISPHGHCDPSWFAENTRFSNPAELFVVPDHYVFRMLVSQGIALEDLGVPRLDDGAVEKDPRKIWHLFAENYHLFRGTPSEMWLNHSFEHVFNLDIPLSKKTADVYYDHIEHCLSQPEFLPRAMFERFNIECLATTEGALDDLAHHRAIQDSDWQGRVITTYRPDAVVDPDYEGFHNNLTELGRITDEDTHSWQGYLSAHRKRRAYFKSLGATATDHGHPSARTADLSLAEAESLFAKILSGDFSEEEADLFRGQVLLEMARMSLDDGLVLQLHAGPMRNHNRTTFERFGRDKGFDIPKPTEYVRALQPLLNAVGMEKDLTIILFTLDETAYGRELSPLAGVYPSLRLGPPWWFFDSVDGIKRFREVMTETAGFYNTAGFNDDTRVFTSIPARHDVSRRSDCAYLARLVAEGRLGETDAYELAHDLTYGLAKSAYKL